MRAGTSTPSDARIFTISGLIHRYEVHSEVGDVVSLSRRASPVACCKKSSGGRLASEYTSASQVRSGDAKTVCPPTPLVSYGRAPPAIGIV